MFRKIIVFLLPLTFLLQCDLPEPEDYIPPVVELIYPYEGVVVSSDMMQIIINATDDDKVKNVRIYFDGSEIGTITSAPYILTVPVAEKKDNLEHVVQAVATDESNNTGLSPLIRFTIARSDDVIDPRVSIVNPQDGQQVEDVVKIVAIAEDERDISMVSFFVNGDSIGESNSYPYTLDWNTAGFADSTNHTIFARAFDTGGNWSVSDVVIVTVFPSTDEIPPNAILTYPTDGQVVFDTVQVTVEASDNKEVAMVEFFVDGQSKFIDMESPYVFEWDTEPYADNASHSLYAKAFDNSGNISTTDIIDVTVSEVSSSDLESPSGAITYPVNGATLAGIVPIIIDVADNVAVDQVEFFVDGVLTQTDTEAPWGFEWDTAPLADNRVHSIFIRTFDKAGNSSISAVVSVTLSKESDIEPPEVILLYPIAGATVDGVVNIAVDAVDNIGVVRADFYIDGVVQSIDTSPTWGYAWNTDGLVSGSVHTIYVKAYDAAGNVGNTGVITVTKQ